MAYILALDEGTTSARALVFDSDAVIRGIGQQEFRQIFPKPGWVEHDAEEIYSTQLNAASHALAAAKLSTRDVAAIGITNQRETTVVWHRDTGRPIYNAIVWQDRRTAPHCDKLRSDGYEPLIQKRTGLLIDAYFSASKIAWLLEHVDGARALAEAGKLAFGTIDTWLVWKLTGGKHVTDVSNASRTMLFDMQRADWDDELLGVFRIPRSMLPTVCSSSEIYGEVAAGALAGIPIAGVAGDQQAALFGQLCVTPGATKNTYGTGCFMLQCTGEKPMVSKNRLLTTVAWKLGGRTEFALEGSVFIGGAVVQWLRDGLGLIKSADEIEPLAASVTDSGGVFLVPAFAGLGAPHWDAHARGGMFGLTRGVTRAHIARAALESIALQVADLLDAMRADSGVSLEELRVDGGAAKNDLLMQFQADILGVPVARPKTTETTALGAAYLAGLAVGTWKTTDELAKQQQIERRFVPAMPRSKADVLQACWREALGRVKGWETAVSPK